MDHPGSLHPYVLSKFVVGKPPADRRSIAKLLWQALISCISAQNQWCSPTALWDSAYGMCVCSYEGCCCSMNR